MPNRNCLERQIKETKVREHYVIPTPHWVAWTYGDNTLLREKPVAGIVAATESPLSETKIPQRQLAVREFRKCASTFYGPGGFAPSRLGTTRLSHASDEGDVVAECMKATRPDIPIVMLSGDEDLPESALRSVDVFVSKSESPATLIEVVEHALETHPLCSPHIGLEKAAEQRIVA